MEKLLCTMRFFISILSTEKQQCAIALSIEQEDIQTQIIM